MTNQINNNSNRQAGVQVLPTDFVFKLISSLKPRTKDILVKRFGLDSDRRQTLEEIGKNHDITRERVRQIESAALKDLQKGNKIKAVEPCESLLESVIAEHGQVMEHNHLVDTFIERISPAKTHGNVVDFILNLSNKFDCHDNTEHTYKAWGTKGSSIEIPRKVIEAAHQVLKKQNKPLSEAEIVKHILQHETVQNHDVSEAKHVQSYLKLGKKILKNPFAEWGFTSWNEIVPKGVKDKAFLVLKKNGKPLHFKEITDKINEISFGGRQAISQTVHNELIKDKRFVLVGRGIYGLTDWGYSSGTVADVVEHVLQAAGKPMAKDEIISKVLEQRMVKRNTVALALQNTKRFQRVDKQSYTLA
ncbi:MAG: HTH domain-containing protein [Parcubacteria group bacterium]